MALACACVLTPSLAQEATAPAPAGNYVSREEYDKLKAELDELKGQMAELLKTKTSPPSRVAEQPESTAAPAEGPTEPKDVNANGTATASSDEVAELRDELAKVKEKAESVQPGTTKFLLTGYAFGGFEKRTGNPSTFTAGFSPILLWQLNDKLFFEGELEIGQEGSDTEIHLEYAHLTYLVNDYLSLGVGKFLTPFAQFPDRLHAAWINKLPDFPLVYNEEGGLVGFSQIGAEFRGGIPIGPVKLVYAGYVSNGPRLRTEMEEGVGTLDFDNFTDIDNNKAVGGRIGILPLAGLELGYSVQGARVKATEASSNHADVLLQAVDFSYLHDFDWIKGGIDVRGEWIWSCVSDLTYDPNGALGFGPIKYGNHRNGGYAQIAYRPYKIKMPIIDKLEAVGRFDMIDQPSGAPDAFDERRWTFGLNYWVGQSTVIKAAYQWGHRHAANDPRGDDDAFLLQAAMGF